MKPRILVIDDDRLVADTLSLVYNANGYECEARYSAEEGLARAKEFSPALLLCDVTMPDTSGLQLADRMHAEMPDTRLLMLTAYTSNAAQVHQQARRMGRPLKLLNKPCRPDDLLRETRALLQA